MAGNIAGDTLVHRVQSAERHLRNYLDGLGNRKLRWLVPDHPVRTKNLEKIIGHLQTILAQVESTGDLRTVGDTRDPTLISLLEQLRDPGQMAFDSAWEVADLLELEILRRADDPYLHMLLNAQQIPDPNDAHRWESHFPKDYLKSLLEGYRDGRFRGDYLRLEARRAVEHLQQLRIGEYRVDRAKAKLRGIYVITMAALLGALDLALAYFYVAASLLTDHTSLAYTRDVLLLVIFAGATGSVLSRAVKLGKQPLHAGADTKVPEPPLGIRALLSGWKVFFAQPVIGATAALVVLLVFSSGLVQLGNSQQLGPAGLTLVGFLAGFSEPFFLGVLDKVVGKAGSR